MNLPAVLLVALLQTSGHKTENVFLVTTDGFRWQELFRGADPDLIVKEQGVANPDAVKADYVRTSAEEKRAALLPFFWSVIAKEGQVYGNRDRGSEAAVTNGKKFSYPGYSELLCGFPDPNIKSNDKIPNANVSVLEWLHAKPAFRGRVAAFGGWDVLPFILNRERAGFLINTGTEPLTKCTPTPQIELLNKLKRETPADWKDGAFDSLVFRTALEYVKADKPRVLYVMLGETDEWAHSRKYGKYLDAAHRVDAWLRELWETAQSMPEYRGKTTMIVLPDHGRGTTPKDWTDHGEKVADAEQIWMAFLGPDTPAKGERSGVAPVTQSQVAATLAALLGEDYRAAVPQAGAPIAP